MSAWIPVLIGVTLLNHLLLSPSAEQRSASLAVLGPSLAALLSITCPLLYGLRALLNSLNADALFWLLSVWVLAGAVHLLQLATSRLRPEQAKQPLWPVLMANALLALIMASSASHFTASVLLGVGAGLGLWLLLLIFNDWRQRLERCALPAALRGAPILLISAGLLGLALLGLDGMGAV